MHRVSDGDNDDEDDKGIKDGLSLFLEKSKPIGESMGVEQLFAKEKSEEKRNAKADFLLLRS